MKCLSFGLIPPAGEEHSSLAQWDQYGFNEQLMGPRLGRITGRTGKIFLKYSLSMEGQLHQLGKTYLSEGESIPEYLETDRADVFVEEVQMKSLVNPRAPSAGCYS